MRDARLSRVLYGSITAFAGRGLAVVVNAVLLPLTLRYLGRLEFGIWVTITTSVLMLSVLDLGIANTLTNSISQAYAEQDNTKAARLFATAFWVTCSVVLLLSPIACLAWRALDWAAVFNLADPTQVRHAASCVALAVAYGLFSLPLNLANKVLAGYQQVHVTNYFAMANSLLSLVAILATIALHGSIVQLMALYCTALLAGTVGLNLWLCLWHKPWLRPDPRRADLRVARKMFGEGFLFFLIQCTGIVVFGSDNLVIAHYLGPVQVTPYSFAWRIANYAAMIQTIMLPSLWPAFSEAYHNRQLDWVRATYRAVTRKSLAAVSLAAILIGLFGRPIIRVWAGQGAVPEARLLWLMAAFTLLMAATTNQAFLLNATGRIRLEAAAAVLAAITNLALSVFLVQRIGADGVILSTILSFLVFMVVPQHFEVERVLSGRYLAPKESLVDGTSPFGE